MRSEWNVAAAFAAGVVAMYFVDAALSRRRISAASPSDSQLRERIRARLPELVSEPNAIDIEVHSGVVRVSGRLPPDERGSLLMQLTDMPGVRMVRNSVSVFDRSPQLGNLQV